MKHCIIPEVSSKKAIAKLNEPEDGNPMSLLNPLVDISVPESNNYISSALKVPATFSLKDEMGSIFKHIQEAGRQLKSISDFSTKTPLAKRASPFPGPLENPSFQFTGPDITHWEQTQKQSKQPIQTSFRPVAQPKTFVKIEEIGNSFFEDFECSMEEATPGEELRVFETLDLPQIEFVAASNELEIEKEDNPVILLSKFVDKLLSRSKNFKVYTCDICNKNFNNHAALGGHKAKNHPHSSKSFIERKKTFELRKSERNKREFLRKF